MINLKIDAKKNIYRILLQPNRSMTWKNNLIFLLVIFVTCFLIATLFAFAGATLILPFAGLEVLLVVICVYLVANKSKKNEILTLTPEKLVVERGSYNSREVIEYIRLWTQVEIEKPIHPWYPLHLVIASKGERVPIGDFLNEEEKLELIDKMEEIILSLRGKELIKD
tara:strand:+ start:2257 stop:2760 length:504 start_codon:yes stop_codon:yes gene_type:complete